MNKEVGFGRGFQGIKSNPVDIIVCSVFNKYNLFSFKKVIFFTICGGGYSVINGTTRLMEMTVDGCIENRQMEEREH
jgi:hypothetical protein